MKKILVLMLALALVFSLAACAADDPSVPDFTVEAVATS